MSLFWNFFKKKDPLDILYNSLKSKNSGYRAAMNLNSFDLGPKSYDLILQALSDSNRHRKINAASWGIRGYYSDVRAIPPLLSLLNDKDSEIVCAAVDGIGELIYILHKKGEGSTASHENKATIIDDLIEPLITAYNKNNDKVRENVIRILADIGGKQVEAFIFGALRETKQEVVVRAIKALGDLKVSDAVVPLIELYRNGNDEVRASVIKTLSNIGGEKAVDCIIGALSDPFEEVISSAAEGLGKLKVNKAVGALITLLEHYYITDTSVSADQAQLKMQEMKQLGIPENSFVASAFSDIISVKFEFSVISKTIEALGELSDKQAIETIAKFLCLNNRTYRFKAARALIKLGDSRGLDGLAKELDELDQSDENSIDFDRCSLVSELAKSDDPRVPDILLAAFAKITPGGDSVNIMDSDVWLAATLIAALGKHGDRRAIEFINKWSEKELESLFINEDTVKTLKDFGVVPKEKKVLVGRGKVEC